MKKIYLVLLLLSVGVSAFSQVRLSGKITDQDGIAVPGAIVHIKDSQVGTMSDPDGVYTIETAKADDILVFSFMGMKTQELVVGNRTELNVTLEEYAQSLDDVVVIGYGSVQKKDLTGSVSSISSTDLIKESTGSLDQILGGKLAGVTISNSDNAPGAGVNILIRGAGSINASSDPLYVIDGFPIEVSDSEGSGASSSPLTGLDPNDIKSIDVLKDASATAIYGARGANGVVIITTKGGDSKELSVNLTASVGVAQLTNNNYVALNAEGYAQMMQDSFYPFAKRMDPQPTPDQPAYGWYDVSRYEGYQGTDWLDEIIRLGSYQNYSLSISGGNKSKTFGDYSFLASGSYYKNEGIIKNTGYDRITSNFKVTAKPREWIELSLNTNASHSKNNGTITITSEGTAHSAGIIQQAFRATPLRRPDGSIILDEEIDDSYVGSPLSTVEDTKLLKNESRVISSVSSTFTLLPGLKFKVLGGITYTKMDDNYYAPSTTNWGSSANGKARIINTNQRSMLNENILSYWKSFNNNTHKLSAIAGFTLQSNESFRTQMENSSFVFEHLDYHNIGVGENFSAPQSGFVDYALMSYLTRVNYTFKEKYLLTASLRADGSSKFAEGSKWGYFPSMSLAWRVDQEKFLQNADWISNFKFRAGWGLTGNPNIDPYQSLANYDAVKYASGTSSSVGVAPSNIANPELRWETSEQMNVGFDFGTLKNRINLTVDLYHKTTRDLLIRSDIPYSSGYSSYLYNSGNIENKGIEVALNTVIMDREFKWTNNFNISMNKNTVKSIGELATSDWMQVPGAKKGNMAILKEGEPIGLWYGYQTNGIWKQEDFVWDNSVSKYTPKDTTTPGITGMQPGDWKIVDLSGPDGKPDGIINEHDKTIIGRSQPVLIGGMTNKFQWREFDMSIHMEWSIGRDIFNDNARMLIDRAGNYDNSLAVDRYRPVQYKLDSSGNETDVIIDPGNPNGVYPAAGSISAYNDIHDGYIEDGSYLKIKNINVGYTLNNRHTSAMGVHRLRFSLSVNNAFTFTSYSGFDPDVNAQSLNGLRPGYDYSSYPMSRSYIFSVSATF